MTQKEYKEKIIDKFVLKRYETNLYVQGRHLLYLIKPKNTESGDPRLLITYNVVDASQPTQLYYYDVEKQTIGVDIFDKVEIDGTEVSITDLDSASGAYQLSSGEHTVAYTLKDPTSIGMSAFDSCSSLTSVTIPNSVTSIGDEAFQRCFNLTSVTIPNSVRSINERVFYYCSGLKSVTIPNGVTSIGMSAFNQCYSLTSIEIPDSVTSIATYAFYNCTSLASITSHATTAPTIQNNTFQGVNSGGRLYVPSGSTGYDVWMGTGDYYLGKYGWQIS